VTLGRPTNWTYSAKPDNPWRWWTVTFELPTPRLADTAFFLGRVTIFYRRPMRWMRRRGDRVTITTGKYAGHTGTVESKVHQRTVDYPEEFANGFHVMLDTEEVVTVRWGQVRSLR
jgi:hypothetical protein